MIWKKRGTATDYEQFVKENTGLTIAEMDDTNREYHIKNLDKVRDEILQAVKNGTKIYVVGDYDADGIGALVIMSILCMTIKADYSIIIPKRISEGYGLSKKIVDRIGPGGLLITIDNGITAVDTIQMAKDKGMKVIVMDHHIGGEVLPPADIIIDPITIKDSADYLYYCGAGLGFKLLEFMIGKDHPITKMASVYAALSTIGDSVSLTGDNRRIVKQGLDELYNGQYTNCGIKTLYQQSKLDEFSTAEDMAFYLIPCINAPGRLYDDGGKMAISTIFCKNDGTAEARVEDLIEVNEERKKIVSTYMEEINLEEARKDEKGFVLYYRPDLPEGLAGLLAGRFAEATGKPSIVLCKNEDGDLKGSCRSNVEAVNLKETFDQFPELFLSYGGHKEAAGIKIKEENFEKFKEALTKFMPLHKPQDHIYYDFEIQAKDVIELSDKQDIMEPFGKGNPCPIVCIKNIRIGDTFGNTYKYMGENQEHAKLHFMSFKALGFHMGEKMKQYEDVTYFDLLGRVEKNHYKGKVYYQIRLVDFRPSERN